MLRVSSRSLAKVLALLLPALCTHAPSAAAGAPAESTKSTKSASDDETELSLQEQLSQVLAADFLQDAKVSVSVVDTATGEVIFEHGAQLALNPASNTKLFTTAGALTILGPEHRYATRAYYDKQKLSGGVLSGPIYLEGGGDPSLVTGDLYDLALRIRAAGIRKITGGIVVDSTRFDADGLPPGFDQKNEFASYRAPGGATSVNFNTYEVLVHPTSQLGAPAVANIAPAVASISIVNKTKTVEGRRNRVSVAVDEDQGKTVVTLSGNVGADAIRASYRYPVADPSKYAGETFAVVLKQAGVSLSRRSVKRGDVPSRASLVGTQRSATLGVLVQSVNKLSNNFMAEQILRTLAEGEGATAAAALERLRAYSAEIGVPQEGLKLGNGSGLYDNNRISAAQMTHLLRSVYGDFRYRADFLASLAVMGIDGTTRKRLRDTTSARWIRGKTGTLDGVSALSGYAGAPGGKVVAFSIMMNDLGRWETGAARRVQDDIARLVAEALVPQASPAPG